jgi:hypothetical protein
MNEDNKGILIAVLGRIEAASAVIFRTRCGCWLRGKVKKGCIKTAQKCRDNNNIFY